jgi:CRISPR/Cas system-associated endonuclease/helicase Cas3
MQTEKKCPLCGHIKPIEEFDQYFSKERQKHRIQSRCRPCMLKSAKERNKARYWENPEPKKQYAKEYREKNWEKVKEVAKIIRREYRAEVHNVYVREQLRQSGFTTQDLNENPEIVQVKKMQILLQRKLKQ